MKRIISAALALYMALSLAISAAYNLSADPWSVAEHRHGLLVFQISTPDENRPAGRDGVEIWLLNPFTSYGDDWLFGIGPGLGVRFCY